MNEPKIREIRTRQEFMDLAVELGVRADWHEPDEQDLTARVEGTPLNFDNAMGCHWYGRNLQHIGIEPQAELHVIFSRREVDAEGVARRGPDIAAVNLATLCAWASERPTARVGHYLNEGFEIPANVLQVEDAEGDLWERTTPEQDATHLEQHGQTFGWRSVPTGGGLSTPEGLFPGPVKVTKVG